MKKFGCTTPFGPNIDHICTNQTKGKEATKLFKSLRSATYQIKECPYPCKFVKSMVLPLRSRFENSTTKFRTTLRFDKFIKVTEAKYSYTELELFGEFGGYVGLFLGVSVFHISQVIDTLLNIVFPH